jgi:transposase
MDIMEVCPGDLALLKQKARWEQGAKQRDRFRAVVMAMEGITAPAIMDKLDRSKNFVQRWNYAYRDGGIEAIVEKQRSGRPVKLSPDEELSFKQRITAGPVATDPTCTLRGTDAMAILEKEFGVQYSLPGVYALMHRLGLSCLKPRPQHLKNDPEKMQQWLDEAPFLSKPFKPGTRTKTSTSGSRMKSELANKEH